MLTEDREIPVSVAISLSEKPSNTRVSICRITAAWNPESVDQSRTPGLGEAAVGRPRSVLALSACDNVETEDDRPWPFVDTVAEDPAGAIAAPGAIVVPAPEKLDGVGAEVRGAVATRVIADGEGPANLDEVGKGVLSLIRPQLPRRWHPRQHEHAQLLHVDPLARPAARARPSRRLGTTSPAKKQPPGKHRPSR